MSNVTLPIGGRTYTVACADGEEPHLKRLGRMIDGKLGENSGLRSQNEARMLLFAAIMLADELHEAQSARANEAPARDPQADAVIADRMDRIARRLEALEQHLEDGAANA